MLAQAVNATWYKGLPEYLKLTPQRFGTLDELATAAAGGPKRRYMSGTSSTHKASPATPPVKPWLGGREHDDASGRDSVLRGSLDDQMNDQSMHLPGQSNF